jgi:exonuclease VII small subunit
MSSNTNQLEEIMKNIENKTVKKVLEGYQTGKISITTDKPKIQQSQDVLVNIMQQGADEFKEKTGRAMTYSEMRAMYG